MYLQALCKSVQYGDILETIQLLFSGADVSIHFPDTRYLLSHTVCAERLDSRDPFCHPALILPSMTSCCPLVKRTSKGKYNELGLMVGKISQFNLIRHLRCQ